MSTDTKRHRGKQLMPTKAERAEYLRVLREKAMRGDVDAIKALLEIKEGA